MPHFNTEPLKRYLRSVRGKSTFAFLFLLSAGAILLAISQRSDAKDSFHHAIVAFALGFTFDFFSFIGGVVALLKKRRSSGLPFFGAALYIFSVLVSPMSISGSLNLVSANIYVYEMIDIVLLLILHIICQAPCWYTMKET